jgi:hypothetical protein
LRARRQNPLPILQFCHLNSLNCECDFDLADKRPADKKRTGARRR